MSEQVSYKFKTKLGEVIDNNSLLLPQQQENVFEGYQPEITSINNLIINNICSSYSSNGKSNGQQQQNHQQFKGQFDNNGTQSIAHSLVEQSIGRQQQISLHSQNEFEQSINEYPAEDFRWEIEKRYKQSSVNQSYRYPRKVIVKFSDKINDATCLIQSNESLESSRDSFDESLLSIDNASIYNLHEQNMKNYQREYMAVYEEQEEKTHKIKMEEVLRHQKLEQNIIEEQRRQYFEKQQKFISQQVFVQHQQEKALRQNMMIHNELYKQPSENNIKQHSYSVIQTETSIPQQYQQDSVMIQQFKDLLSSQQLTFSKEMVDFQNNQKQCYQKQQQQSYQFGDRRMKTEGNEGNKFSGGNCKPIYTEILAFTEKMQTDTQGYYDHRDSVNSIENFEDAFQDGSDIDPEEIARLDQFTEKKDQQEPYQQLQHQNQCKTSNSPTPKAKQNKSILQNSQLFPVQIVQRNRNQSGKQFTSSKKGISFEVPHRKNYKQLMDILEKAQKSRDVSSISGTITHSINGLDIMNKEILTQGKSGNPLVLFKNQSSQLNKTSSMRISSSLNAHSGRQMPTVYIPSGNKKIIKGYEKPSVQNSQRISINSTVSIQKKEKVRKELTQNSEQGISQTELAISQIPKAINNSRQRSSSGKPNGIIQKTSSLQMTCFNPNSLSKQIENQKLESMKSSISKDEKGQQRSSSSFYPVAAISNSYSGGYLNSSQKIVNASTAMSSTINTLSNSAKYPHNVRTTNTSNHQNGSTSSLINTSNQVVNLQGFGGVGAIKISGFGSSNSKKQILSNSNSSQKIIDNNQQNTAQTSKLSFQAQYHIQESEIQKGRISHSFAHTRVSTDVDRDYERNQTQSGLQKIPSKKGLSSKNGSLSRKEGNQSDQKMSLREQLLHQQQNIISQKGNSQQLNKSVQQQNNTITLVSRMPTECSEAYGPQLIDQNMQNGQIDKIREFLKQQQQQQGNQKGGQKVYQNIQNSQQGKQITALQQQEQQYIQRDYQREILSPHSLVSNNAFNQLQPKSIQTQNYFQKQIR